MLIRYERQEETRQRSLFYTEQGRTQPIAPISKIKRSFDILLCGPIFIATSPVFFLASVGLFLEQFLRGSSRVAIFYEDIRISASKPFPLIKFHIFRPAVIEKMRVQGEFINTKELERNGSLLIVGRMLKQTYLDELSQLINVLRGDMSLVGPRPVNKKVYADLLTRGPTPKSTIKAGMTGYFQSHKDTRGYTDRELDQRYADFCRENPAWKVVFFDLLIIARTIKVLLRAKGV